MSVCIDSLTYTKNNTHKNANTQFTKENEKSFHEKKNVIFPS